MRLLRALGAALMVAGLLLTVTSTATAQTSPQPVTDFADYPDTSQAMLTDGCDFSGVTGVAFSVNGQPTTGDLGALPELAAGDAVTMSWAGVTPACVGSAISLAVKDAPAPIFDPAVDQPITPGGYTVTFLTAGAGSVTLIMPDLTPFGHACAYQMDAVVGLPLAIVGPSGSFYSAASRGDNRRTTLISFRNSAYEVCTTQETTTTTTAPTTTTTTAPTTTTTTAPTTTTTAPTTTTTARTSPPTTDPSVANVSTSAAQGTQAAAQAQRALAATGSTPWTALVGLVAVSLGVLLLVGSRRGLAMARRSS
jgi:hypothetical protein